MPTPTLQGTLALTHLVGPAKAKRTSKTRWLLDAALFCAALVCVLVLAATQLYAADASEQLRVPAGFRVELYADDNLAHDIYSMTVDAQGRVVVSGAGYVRILEDTDGDGVADRFVTFADGPKSGAQGLFCDGADLLCSGDGGLLRYRDRDADDRADGSPELLLKIQAGGEHHAHAMRRGPDGDWYLIAGNLAGVDAGYATAESSPLTRPQAGTLLRLSPDLSRSEVVCDGFRNAYDFAFNEQGDVFVYDSDGERDVSLPWYRPTRVFHALPASHAGWTSRSWKRPDHYPDMPPVLAAFGRGSPTGVVCYRHHAFPTSFHNAILVADWTFGRVLALPLKVKGSTWKSEPIELVRGIGQFGFAPSDLAVGADGSLFVSVGGRGTRGGVYRITAAEPQSPAAVENTSLARCLNAPQPLSSWSRAQWVPAAKKLGREPFVAAALAPTMTARQRVRAIEILVELFAGLRADEATRLLSDDSAAVRSRVAWALGRRPLQDEQPMIRSLKDGDAHVVRWALEALLTRPAKQSLSPGLAEAVSRQLDAHRSVVRQTAARVVNRFSSSVQPPSLSRPPTRDEHLAAICWYMGRAQRNDRLDAEALRFGLDRLRDNQPAYRREAVRLIQLALGDVGPAAGKPPLFDSYRIVGDRDCPTKFAERAAREIARAFPCGDRVLDAELARIAAMIQSTEPTMLTKVMERVTADSHPSDDVHYLTVAARLRTASAAASRDRVAKGLLGLERKIRSRQLNLDSNWEPRMGELVEALAARDPQLLSALVDDPDFGLPSDLLLIRTASPSVRSRALDRIAARIRAEKDYPWNDAVVAALGSSPRMQDQELVIAQFDNPVLRDAVLLQLARRPQQKQRPMLVAGLQSHSLSVLRACVAAFGKLPPSKDAEEQVLLARLLQRLGTERNELPVRDNVVQQLRRNLEEEHGYELGQPRDPQEQAIRGWISSVKKQFPQLAGKLETSSQSNLQALRKQLAEVAWSQGEAKRGKLVFEKRACHRCHGGRRAVGPALEGATRRFSRDDLFVAIAQPSRNVPLRYQPTVIETTRGQVYTGLVVYESVDGVTLRNGLQTMRIEANEIEHKQLSSRSLMPDGLLDDMTLDELADLYAYLQSLR